MSQIQRPTKQGGATTYQGKVGAGYTTILASEMDADLDTIYSAWNTGVDGSNIRPGVITGGMLAPGAVGSRELADGGIQTIDLGDGQVTHAKLGPDVTAPPSGAAGGDLSGSYPNPNLGPIQGGVLQLVSRAGLTAAPGTVDLYGNHPTNPGHDNTKPTWMVRLDYTNDTFEVWRSPDGTTGYSRFLFLTGAGRFTANLADGIVGRVHLATNAIYGASTLSACSSTFVMSSPVGSWVNYMTLAPITTRGGNVMLLGQHNLSCNGPSAGGMIAQRWVQGFTPLHERAFVVSGPTAQPYAPLPGLFQIDTPPAGTYTYSMQLWLNNAGCNIISSGTTQGFLQAVEIG